MCVGAEINFVASSAFAELGAGVKGFASAANETAFGLGETLAADTMQLLHRTTMIVASLPADVQGMLTRVTTYVQDQGLITDTGDLVNRTAEAVLALPAEWQRAFGAVVGDVKGAAVSLMNGTQPAAAQLPGAALNATASAAQTASGSAQQALRGLPPRPPLPAAGQLPALPDVGKGGFSVGPVALPPLPDLAAVRGGLGDGLTAATETVNRTAAGLAGGAGGLVSQAGLVLRDGPGGLAPAVSAATAAAKGAALGFAGGAVQLANNTATSLANLGGGAVRLANTTATGAAPDHIA